MKERKQEIEEAARKEASKKVKGFIFINKSKNQVALLIIKK